MYKKNKKKILFSQRTMTSHNPGERGAASHIDLSPPHYTAHGFIPFTNTSSTFFSPNPSSPITLKPPALQNHHHHLCLPYLLLMRSRSWFFFFLFILLSIPYTIHIVHILILLLSTTNSTWIRH